MTEKKMLCLWITFVVSALSLLIFNAWWIEESFSKGISFIVTIVTVVFFLGLFPAVGMWLESKVVK